MKLSDCTVTDCGNAVAIDLPCRQASDGTIKTFIDPDVYHDLLTQDASLHIRSRRNQPCVMVSFPDAKNEQYLARYVMHDPPAHVHHSLVGNRAFNLFNTRDMLQILTPGEHAAIHRRAEAKTRRGLQNER